MKVGSERESATSDNFAKFGVDEIGVFLSLFSPRGPPKIGPLLRILLPKRTLSTDGICRPRSGFTYRSFHNATQSGAQLFITIAPRSGFSYHSNFASGPPKPSRNRPDTARVQNRYFLKGRGVPYQTKLTSSIFEEAAPARRELGKIQNVGRCPRQAPGIQENPGI